jgi:hypothetical protein
VRSIFPLASIITKLFVIVNEGFRKTGAAEATTRRAQLGARDSLKQLLGISQLDG